MKTLILMRHAKSDWTSGVSGDHARPLNARGRRVAPMIAAWLAEQGYRPDKVLTSDAARTLETWDLMRPVLGGDIPVVARRDLYLAEPEEMRHALRSASGACVLLLGHNPGIAELAQDMASDAPRPGRFGDYPTAATTVLEVDCQTWKDLPREGQVLDFVIPADL